MIPMRGNNVWKPRKDLLGGHCERATGAWQSAGMPEKARLLLPPRGIAMTCITLAKCFKGFSFVLILAGLNLAGCLPAFAAAVTKTTAVETMAAETAVAEATAAGATGASGDFIAQGKNRAAVQMERAVYAEPLNLDFLLGTLATKSTALKNVGEPRYLYQEVDPVPLHSYKVFTPWLSHFKQSVVFVIGRLDAKRLNLARWSVSVHDPSGQVVKTFSGAGTPPTAFYWNGRDSQQNPVEVGKPYIPEITLVDVYGATVSLPQKNLLLEEFIWDQPGRMRAGALQDHVFQKQRERFSNSGLLVMRELSHLVDQHDTILLDIECSGPDLDLARERALTLQKFFAKENLRIKKIRLASITRSENAVFYLNAVKTR